MSRPTHFLISLIATFALVAGGVNESHAKSPVDFARDIAPVLERHCIRCHQPANAKSELSLATFADLAGNGYVVPGEPNGSHLLDVVTAAIGEEPLMPKEGPPLSESDVELLRRWIAEGANWPDEIVVREKPKADRTWWSLQPLAVTEPPSEAIPSAWDKNPIDRFIYLQLAANKLEPNPRADRRTLLRRMTYDITGLPPTPEEADAFLHDDAPEAYERLVDRLLASPHYGEHWGRHWLDVTRFGESTGFEINHLVENAWPFRDYVIRSFNDDKPFDRFVIEHLAGDAVGPGDAAIEVGLTFLVCGPVDIVGNADAAQAAQIRADAMDEMIRATSEAFLGLTIGCARCHDHKFDPVSQQDYYRLFATFTGVRHGDRLVGPQDQLRERKQKLAQLEAQKKQVLDEKSAAEKSAGEGFDSQKFDMQLAELEQQIKGLPAFPSLRVGNFEQPVRPQHVFLGGDAGRSGETAAPASISTLGEVAEPYALSDDAPEQLRRLALARWIVAADNPLTSRVLANRLWHYHFGTGIVATTSDFGYMGEKPTHPQLLDWLASRLHAEGWRLKPVHKLIVMSETYQQSSAYRAEAAQVDANARLLWRFPPRRLAAEEIRDTILLLAGRLEDRGGGPGFQLYQYSRDNVATYTPLESFGPETYRRSVYHQNARASRIDLLTDFDAPDCAFSVSRRIPTSTPSQALALMNHSFTMSMAESLAARLLTEAGDDDVPAQVNLAFELAFGREPASAEAAAALALAEQYGVRAFCRALLNSSELIYVN
ncbi:MAG: PSD1 and planctomycete cytochrome C domain-containing protein [Pirellulales bacterium]